jgi:hypothetical protein
VSSDRDTLRTCIATSNKVLLHVLDAPIAGAYALRGGHVLAQQVGINNCIGQTIGMQVFESANNE